MSEASSAFDAVGLSLADDLAEADHGDAVGDLAHLAQLVGDEHDRGARLFQLAHDDHELVGLLRGEHGGRLVEHEHLRVAGQRLDDLDPLLHAHRQVFDERVGVDVEAEPRRDLFDLLARGGQVEQAARLGRLVAEHDVLGDREDGDEHEVLVHHADAGGHGIAGPVEVLHLVVEEHLALVGLVQAVEHVHERRLACTVLAQQAVDLSSLYGEVDVVVRDQAAETLRDAAKFELHVPDPSDSTASVAVAARMLNVSDVVRSDVARTSRRRIRQQSGEAGVRRPPRSKRRPYSAAAR